MDSNSSAERFYPLTTDSPATLPSTATSPDPRYRRHSSSSDSVSDGYSGGLYHSAVQSRVQPGLGIYRPSPGGHFPPGRVQNPVANIYADDEPYDPPSFHQGSQSHRHVETAPDDHVMAPFADHDPRFPPPMSSGMPHPTSSQGSQGYSSPNSSPGSGGSEHSGRHSVTSQGSVSSGVGRQPLEGAGYGQHDQGVFPHPQRAGQAMSFNPEHYPAYDEQRRRVGMEHARFGTDPQNPLGHGYYRDRNQPFGSQFVQMHPNASQGEPFPLPGGVMSPGLQGAPSFFPSHTSNAGVVPGHTRIHIPDPQQPLLDFMDLDTLQTINQADDEFVNPSSDAEIRRFLGLSPDQEMSLAALADPPPGQRPNHSIPVLSQLAILGSPNRRLMLQEIYQALEDRFEWFRNNTHDKAWKNSIRHNLSLYSCFRKETKPITEPGKGSYWVVDYSHGSGTKRPRKRNKRPTKAEREQRQREREEELARQAESGFEGSDDDGSSASPMLHSFDIEPTPSRATGRAPPATSSRSARRGDSPYAQPPGLPGRSMRSTPAPQQTAPPSMMHPSGMQPLRQPSATLGQHAFGQPSWNTPPLARYHQAGRSMLPTAVDPPQANQQPAFAVDPQLLPGGARGGHHMSRSQTMPVQSSASGYALQMMQAQYAQGMHHAGYTGGPYRSSQSQAMAMSQPSMGEFVQGSSRPPLQQQQLRERGSSASSGSGSSRG